MTVLDKFLKGDSRALSRIVSFVENRQDGYLELLSKLYPRTGSTLRIGITGPPGAGKSTLVDMLLRKFIEDDKKIGVIAVDPTSPFTGGALLGDRVRMNNHPVDCGIFFRSMATRGATGGLAGSTDNVAICYDAFGFDVTLIETVGVGQVELDIVDNCDVVIVVLVPESGDSVQTMKAGLLEVADVFCINKADRSGSDRIVSDLMQSLDLKAFNDERKKPPVIATEAINGKGIDELYSSIISFVEEQNQSGRFGKRRRMRLEKKIHSILRFHFQRDYLEAITSREEFEQHLDDILAGKSDPFKIGQQLYQKFDKNQL